MRALVAAGAVAITSPTATPRKLHVRSIIINTELDVGSSSSFGRAWRRGVGDEAWSKEVLEAIENPGSYAFFEGGSTMGRLIVRIGIAMHKC
jgi:hypothetical protein